MDTSEKIYYSAVDKGFYHSSINPKIPQDAVEITADEYERLLTAHCQGMAIELNEDGYPVAVPIVISHEEQVEFAKQTKMQHFHTASEKVSMYEDAVELGLATEQERAALDAWKRYRILVNRVDLQQAPDIEWPTPPAE